MNEIYDKLIETEHEIQHLVLADSTAHRTHCIRNIRTLLCQVRETLEALEAKQKIWDQKEASQEDQPEQEHSTQPNDQKLPEKEQSQKTRNLSRKQYIISYPPGAVEIAPGIRRFNCDIADVMKEQLQKGMDITIPNTWRVQVVDLC